MDDARRFALLRRRRRRPALPGAGSALSRVSGYWRLGRRRQRRERDNGKGGGGGGGGGGCDGCMARFGRDVDIARDAVGPARHVSLSEALAQRGRRHGLHDRPVVPRRAGVVGFGGRRPRDARREVEPRGDLLRQRRVPRPLPSPLGGERGQDEGGEARVALGHVHGRIDRPLAGRRRQYRAVARGGHRHPQAAVPRRAGRQERVRAFRELRLLHPEAHGLGVGVAGGPLQPGGHDAHPRALGLPEGPEQRPAPREDVESWRGRGRLVARQWTKKTWVSALARPPVVRAVVCGQADGGRRGGPVEGGLEGPHPGAGHGRWDPTHRRQRHPRPPVA
mmetsp:Transcript_6383/g.11780  ORF Transcript_6383/g.11780 Transcript_6383/m.11780 type:complete len:335 (+) Transcript_6383:831-1835(+)